MIAWCYYITSALQINKMKDNEFFMLMRMLRGLMSRSMISEVLKIADGVTSKLTNGQREELARYIIDERAYAEKRELIEKESYGLIARMSEYDYF